MMTSATTATEQQPLSAAATSYLLAFADDEHMIGARHTSWIGMGPFLEEDLAFCSIAQDELGHAIFLYEFLSDDIDRFALLRQPAQYRSCSFAELACDAWQDALVRHWLYDRAEELRWEALTSSNNARLAEIAVRAEREEVFHRAHASTFMARICASGDRTSVELVSDAIERLLPIAQGIWEPSELEAEAIAEGFASSASADLAEIWRRRVEEDLRSWGLAISWPTSDTSEDRTNRSTGFDEFLTSLQEVITIDPTAQW